jgi:hypothetical protein
MIARFKLVFLACFFMFSSPALAQEDEFAKIFSYYDGALKCQAATKLTANYVIIYQTLNRGLEKVDPEQASAFKSKLDKQWATLEKIVVIAKEKLGQINPNLNYDREEQRIFNESVKQLTKNVRQLAVSQEHILTLMQLNSECLEKANEIITKLTTPQP